MTKLNYLENTYLFQDEAKIINHGENKFGYFIILDKTIFYPQGGGQPNDIGKIIIGNNYFEVKNVQLDENGIVFHYGNFFIKNEENIFNKNVFLDINKENRIKNSKNHTAGHLVDLAVKNIGLDLIVKKGFHFDNGPYVEYFGTYNIEEKDEILKKLEKEINNLISQNLKIFIENNLEGNIGKGKSFRKFYFENYKKNAYGCGGTHLKTTGEIGKILIKNIKNKKGNCKISYNVF